MTRSRRSPWILASLFAVVSLGSTACTLEPVEGPEEEMAVIETCLGDGESYTFSLDWEYKRWVIEGTFTGADGEPTRFKVYNRWGKKHGFVVFLNGRAGFIEKYDAMFTSLHEFPVDLAPADQTLADLRLTFGTLDHAGQGVSGARTRGDIDDFNIFVEDVDKLVNIVNRFNWHDKPVHLVAHSMGGLIAARYAQTHPDKVDGLVLASPMLVMREIPGLPEQALQFVA